MRFYGKKFIGHAMVRSVKAFTEKRDAVVWSVNKSARECSVRYQGSNINIIAKFPQNMKQIPSWLRAGNSVQISHRSGIRGYVYIIGQGTTIPTPVAGEPFPDPDPLPDAILTGCQITETDTITMGVLISSGTYRINDVEYTLSISDNWLLYDQIPIIYYDQEPIIYYDGVITKYIDAAPSVGNFRYDAFVVGENEIIDYIKGIESTTPIKPSIPTDHLLIDDYILVIGGITAIENKYIGMQWGEPSVSSIDINIEGEGISYDMPYDDAGTPGVPGDDPQYTYADIVFTVLNQYNQPISGSYTLNITSIAGTGDFWSDDTGYNDSAVSQVISGSSYTFKYRREQLVDSDSVVFSATIKIGTSTFELIGIINLEVDS